MFHVGVDLGQKRDHSAIAVVELANGGQRMVRGLARVPLGTPYPAVVERVRGVVQHPKFLGRCTLTVDATGVGAPVVDLLRWAQLGSEMRAVTITGGDKAHQRGGAAWTVPKQDLLSGLQVLLERNEIRIARGLRDAEALVRELRDMRGERGASGKVKMGAEGYGEHDDLVVALALACWRGGKVAPPLLGQAPLLSF